MHIGNCLKPVVLKYAIHNAGIMRALMAMIHHLELESQSFTNARVAVVVLSRIKNCFLHREHNYPRILRLVNFVFLEVFSLYALGRPYRLSQRPMEPFHITVASKVSEEST